jgi:hypothetical protein
MAGDESGLAVETRKDDCTCSQELGHMGSERRAMKGVDMIGL